MINDSEQEILDKFRELLGLLKVEREDTTEGHHRGRHLSIIITELEGSFSRFNTMVVENDPAGWRI